MNTAQKVAKNTLVLFIAQLFSTILGFAYTIYIAREMNSEGFGILSFALAFAGVFVLCVDLGLTTLTTRDISRKKNEFEKYLVNVFLIRVVLSIITILLILIIIIYMKYSEQTVKVVFFVSLSLIFINYSTIFQSIFQAFEKMEYVSISQILSSLLMYSGIYFAIKLNVSIIGIGIVYFIVSIIVFGYNLLIFSLKFPIKKLKVDLKFCKYLLKESMPFWVSTLFVVIYYRIDIIMLSMMKNEIAVGLYSASYRLIDALSYIASVFMTAMFPVFSRYYIISENSMEIAFRKSFKLMTIIAVPIGIGTSILADKIIYVIYGVGYIQSIIPLKILIWASVFGLINLTSWTLLNSTNRQKILMNYTLFGVVVNIILNCMLIPKMSYTGAAISTVLTEFIVGLLFNYKLFKMNKELFNKASTVTIKSVFSGIVMGAFILFFKSYSIFLLIPVGAMIYFLIFFMIGGIEEDDIVLLTQVLGNKWNFSN